MPELPEVETICQQLDKVLSGKEIKKVSVLREKSFMGNHDWLVGKVISSVGREAKMIVFEFEGENKRLVGHLKMTGQLIWRGKGKQAGGGHPSKDWVSKLPGKHTRVIVVFDDGSSLFFNDMRVFGWLKILEERKWEEELDRLPPDVIDKEFSNNYLGRILSSSSRPVKLVIMDQTKMGGIGNIYANDALNLARIDPRRSAGSITKEEGTRLHKAIVEVIDEGIRYKGASASDEKFVDVSGIGGKYQDHFLVYERKGQKCFNCGGVIEKITLGGRGTYYCPDCQK